MLELSRRVGETITIETKWATLHITVVKVFKKVVRLSIETTDPAHLDGAILSPTVPVAELVLLRALRDGGTSRLPAPPRT